MSTKTANLNELRRLLAPWKLQVGTQAIRAGQEVILSGLISRCPVGETGRLRRSIHATAIRMGKRSIGGAVVVGTGYAIPVEYGPFPHPFVRITAQVDGPTAQKAMAAVIKRSVKR
jgi:hypothetical protein